MMKYIIGFIILVLIIVFSINGLHYKTGEGKQVGYVSAVEVEGVFWKTGRVYIKPTMYSTQEDFYCVIDKNLLPQLEEVSRNNIKIEVRNIDYLSFGMKNCAGELSAVNSFIEVK